eukprot:CAMPEP_0198289084 /NCGR_PEP_ID=MMETSP1449-20131203/7411_1 /TAXON_ID=420275 /ORGANISM="Attheya septentrionalis, Strain CCMP2084" /LENGTH=107 /DNA_ID=CAMNT_0043987363 /DNA_START=104 /DNA_END=427 /DNA_ORIENTATION=-
MSSADAFTAPATKLSTLSFVGQTRTVPFMAADEEDTRPTAAGFEGERGVSIDQDGKSNVWAIEPKVEVESKSSEEKTSSALIAGAGLGAFALVAAGILTNLPDPNQF